MRGRIPASILATIALGVVVLAPAAYAADYPDLDTFDPRDLRFDETDVLQETENTPGPIHDTLRFTNTVFNDGEGRLEIFGTVTNPGQVGSEGDAFQRIYEGNTPEETHQIGRFYWHAAHTHYHFDNWGSYQLFTEAEYDAWVANGSNEAEATRKGVKTTSCVMDEEFIGGPASTPFPGRYPSGGCTPGSDGLMTQGLSPGWGDTYDYYRSEQWIDLGLAGGGDALPDGNYVLRSVTDPTNIIYESANKAVASRESIADNEAITRFEVDDGELVDSTPPSGTVAINFTAATTQSRNVNVRIIGTRRRERGAGVPRRERGPGLWRLATLRGHRLDARRVQLDAVGGRWREDRLRAVPRRRRSRR